eukprot:TRINITY_DN561_c1_g7_i1.p2 TRINITY_DN561_c1_g7~~TRINITY_DN561_c1_g7_i1.p2  ORF type:complete len:235 (-),score=3.20 TRINITY_DN561_c1_g7_i1:2761-3465(-)
MLIAGFIKNSLIDYLGKIASVIFTQGCNMRCKFCHNHELIPMKKEELSFSEDEVLSYLAKAKGFIDALVITGGEPTLQPDLYSFIRKVKQLGLSVKLDTNGCRPELLEELLDENLLDYVAMDVKTKLDVDAYRQLVGEQFSADQMRRVEKSILLLKEASIEVEFRTTLIKEMHSPEVIHSICRSLKTEKLYSLQEFRSDHVFDNAFAELSPYKKEEMNVMMQENKKDTPNMRVL